MTGEVGVYVCTCLCMGVCICVKGVELNHPGVR